MFTFTGRIKNAILVSIITVIVSSALLYVFLNPPPTEEYFQLYILGTNATAENYFPYNQSNITSGTLIRWYLGVQNHRSQPQYVSIKLKLGNSSLYHPNSTDCTPSSFSVLSEYKRLFAINETNEMELAWSIATVQKVGTDVRLTILVDDKEITSSTTAIDGVGYRMIVELWTFDTDTMGFQFGWDDGAKKQCAWTQIWFNVSIPGA